MVRTASFHLLLAFLHSLQRAANAHSRAWSCRVSSSREAHGWARSWINTWKRLGSLETRLPARGFLRSIYLPPVLMKMSVSVEYTEILHPWWMGCSAIVCCGSSEENPCVVLWIMYQFNAEDWTDSIMCDSCLVCYYFNCTGIKQGPKSKMWLCHVWLQSPWLIRNFHMMYVHLSNFSCKLFVWVGTRKVGSLDSIYRWKMQRYHSEGGGELEILEPGLVSPPLTQKARRGLHIGPVSPCTVQCVPIRFKYACHMIVKVCNYPISCTNTCDRKISISSMQTVLT